MVEGVASRIVLDGRVFENNFKVMNLLSRIPKWLRWMAKIFCGLVIIYISIYTINSINGRYEIMMSDIGRIEGFGWVPSGVHFSDRETQREMNWDLSMYYLYYPLWRVDYAHFHPWKDAYITGGQVRLWKNNRQFSDFALLSRKLPPKLSNHVVIIVLGNPTRTNLLSNGLKRWEYDYKSTNGLAFGSLFFNRRGIFEGSSTNANAQIADRN